MTKGGTHTSLLIHKKTHYAYISISGYLPGIRNEYDREKKPFRYNWHLPYNITTAMLSEW